MYLYHEMYFCIGIQILVLCYLLIQTRSDIKEKQVSIMLNNFAIGSACISTMIFMICNNIYFLQAIPWIEIIIIIILLEITSNPKMPKFCHIIGSGDAKAYFVIYITAIPFQIGALFFLALNVLCSTISFLIISIFLKRIKGARYAFFPYLTAGYIVVSLLIDFATY